jgi:Domain of unknown function (DUF4149)
MTDTTKQFCFARFGNVLEHLGLAFMIGGMLALGAFVAPALFHNFPLPEAGIVMTAIFRRYDIVLAVSVAFILMGEIIHLSTVGFSKQLKDRFRLVMVLLIAIVSFFSLVLIHPKMEGYQKAGVVRGVGETGMQFDKLHKQSETLYKAQLILAVILLIFVASANTSRTPTHNA